MRDTFGVFILTHGRPDRVAVTLNTLARGRYTGRWWLLLDDEDPTRDAYGPRGVIFYARNAVDPLAADLGLTHYLQLDDDYDHMSHRFNRDGTLAEVPSHRLDAVFQAMTDFLDDTGALTVAFAQGGDYIGGIYGAYQSPIKRKAMNTFFAKVGQPIGFVGRINEDVNTYVWRGTRGELLLTVTDFNIHQVTTQAHGGGMTETYLDGGTYVKSFYTVMFAPSCTKISTLGEEHHRIHHHVEWNHCTPKVLSSAYRKA